MKVMIELQNSKEYITIERFQTPLWYFVSYDLFKQGSHVYQSLSYFYVREVCFIVKMKTLCQYIGTEERKIKAESFTFITVQAQLLFFHEMITGKNILPKKMVHHLLKYIYLQVSPCQT